jgi:hypothetical protein
VAKNSLPGSRERRVERRAGIDRLLSRGFRAIRGSAPELKFRADTKKPAEAGWVVKFYGFSILTFPGSNMLGCVSIVTQADNLPGFIKRP